LQNGPKELGVNNLFALCLLPWDFPFPIPYYGYVALFPYTYYGYEVLFPSNDGAPIDAATTPYLCPMDVQSSNDENEHEVSGDVCSTLTIADCYLEPWCQPVSVLLRPAVTKNDAVMVESDFCSTFEMVGCMARKDCGQDTRTVRREDGRYFTYATDCPPPAYQEWLATVDKPEHYQEPEDPYHVCSGEYLSRTTDKVRAIESRLCTNSLKRLFSNTTHMEQEKNQYRPFAHGPSPFEQAKVLSGSNHNMPLTVQHTNNNGVALLFKEVNAKEATFALRLALFDSSLKMVENRLLSTDESGEYFHLIPLTDDQGFAILGSRPGTATPDSRFWIMKTDRLGKVLWKKEHVEQVLDRIERAILTADGGLILLGERTGNYSTDNHDLWMIRLDTSGDTMWMMPVGKKSPGTSSILIPSPNGDYTVLYFLQSENTDDYHLVLARFSSSGDLQWNTSLARTSWKKAISLLALPEHSFSMSHYSFFQYLFGTFDGIVIRGKDFGGLVWPEPCNRTEFVIQDYLLGTDDSITVTGEDDYVVFDEEMPTEAPLIECDRVVTTLSASSIDGYYILIQLNSSDPESSQSWLELARFDSSGDLTWNDEYNCERFASAVDLFPLTDGGVVVLGTTEKYEPVGSDIFLLVSDGKRENVWHKTYGSEGNEKAFAVVPWQSGGLLLLGTTSSGASGESDSLLYQLDAHGDVVQKNAPSQ